MTRSDSHARVAQVRQCEACTKFINRDLASSWIRHKLLIKHWIKTAKTCKFSEKKREKSYWTEKLPFGLLENIFSCSDVWSVIVFEYFEKVRWAKESEMTYTLPFPSNNIYYSTLYYPTLPYPTLYISIALVGWGMFTVPFILTGPSLLEVTFLTDHSQNPAFFVCVSVQATCLSLI